MVKHRFARSSARKARLIVDLIRGKDVNTALEAVMFEHRRAKTLVEKALKSAISNANEFLGRMSKNPERYPKIDMKRVESLLSDGVETRLYVKQAFVDGGPTLKRFLPRAFGRASSIHKRTCHITIVLSDERKR